MHFSVGITYRISSISIHWGLHCFIQTCNRWFTTHKKVSNYKIPKLKRLKGTTPNLIVYNSTIREDIIWKQWLFEFYNQTEWSAKCTFFFIKEGNCCDFSICYGTKIHPSFWSFCRASNSLETSQSSIYLKLKQVWKHNGCKIICNSEDVLPVDSNS